MISVVGLRKKLKDFCTDGVLYSRRERYSLDDKEIVALFWNRDENAIKILKKEYEDKLIGLSYRILGNMEDVEECVNCPTAHCERYKPHFDFGDIPSPIVPHRNKLQTQGGMTAH